MTQQPLKLNSILSEVSDYVGSAVSRIVLTKYLKSKGYTYRRIRKVLKKKPDAAQYAEKIQEILKLVALEKQNFVKIYFADESGFNETPCVPYGWQPKGEPLGIPSSKGQRWNVFGIMSSDNQLFYDKTNQSIDSVFVINAIDKFAQSSERAPRSVICMDNASVHHSTIFQDKLPEWQEQGVDIFYLPTYSPHLNRIETLWRKIKYEWLLPQDYASWGALTQKIDYILDNFGTQFSIQFQPF